MSEILSTLGKAVKRQQTRLDEQLASWRGGEAAAVRLWCRAGCANCCTLAVNTTLAEALALAASLDAAQQTRIAASVARIRAHAGNCVDARAFLSGYREEVGACPLLDQDGRCGSYAHRPLACRALLSTRPPDWCGINLAQLPEYERQAFLSSLDREVVDFPTHYAAAPRRLALALEEELLDEMLDKLGFTLSGNLLVLLWLCLHPDLVRALAGGPPDLRELLRAKQLDRPFLALISAD